MAVNHYYVDYSGGDDTTGDGTIGTPWKTIQKAFNTATEGTDGTQINAKANAAHVTAAALDLTTYIATNGALAAAAPITIRGYTTAANDGGMATITVSTNNALFAATNYGYINLVDLQIDGYTGALVDTVYLGVQANIIRCKVTGVGTYKIRVAGSSNVINCYVSGGEFSATTSNGIYATSATVYGCWIESGNDNGINLVQNASAIGNVVNATGAGNGINASNLEAAHIIGNSIYSNGGTGKGITLTNSNIHVVANNVVSGFSGAGGVGIESARLASLFAGNAVYNCTTAYSLTGLQQIEIGNDTAGSDPFVDGANGDFDLNASITGVTEDAWPQTWPGLTTNTAPKADKGAVQAGAGAGASIYRRVARILGG